LFIEKKPVDIWLGYVEHIIVKAVIVWHLI